jgi:hypothetical protein
MARVSPFAAHLLAATLAVGCAGAGKPPCRSCDAGDAQTAPDLDATDTPAPQDLAPADTRPPADDTTDAMPIIHDSAAGEAPSPTPIPDGGYVFVDDFQNTQAPGWQAVGATDRDASLGSWSVILGSSGSLLAQGVLDPSAWHIAYATAPLPTDQMVEAQLRIVDFSDPSPSSVAALFARYDAASDTGYLVALRGDGTVVIRRRDHGVTASWGAGVAAGIRTGTWYTVRLEAIGDALNAFVDGRPVYSVTDDAPLAGGGVALGTLGATLEVDRVTAAEP